MIRGVIVIVVAAMARIFLKKKQYRHHITSMAVLFIGVFLVGLSSMLNPDEGGEASSTSVLGILLLLLGQLFAGGTFVTEEKLLGDYELDPLYVVGCEGMWGMLYWAIMLPIFQHINIENN